MRFEDALFNWLQMEIVAEARPDDRAAADTRDFFLQILSEDHGAASVRIASRDETFLHVAYDRGDGERTESFRREVAEQLLADIRANPKYNEQ